jgi:branched-chain amino acid transport system permease protein
MIQLIQQLVNGLAYAGSFGLIALGISLIFGMTGIINFAQGDLLMLGAYCALFVADATHILVLAIAVSTLALGLFGVLLYRGLFDWVRADPISGFIISIGLITVIENLTQEIAGGQPRSYLSSLGSIHIGDVIFLEGELIVLLVAAVVLGSLLVLYERTSFGRVVRACVEDREAAALMGINVRRVNSRVMGLSGALAGLGGGLVLLLFPISPFIGSSLVINAFLASILGGLRRVEGAVVGALVIGVITGIGDQYGASIWTTGIVYALLIAVLIVRPSGILAPR